jgi:hypothetical protein
MPFLQHLQRVPTIDIPALEKSIEFINSVLPWPICSIEIESEHEGQTTVRLRYADLSILFSIAFFYGKEIGLMEPEQ